MKYIAGYNIYTKDQPVCEEQGFVRRIAQHSPPVPDRVRARAGLAPRQPRPRLGQRPGMLEMTLFLSFCPTTYGRIILGFEPVLAPVEISRADVL